MAYRTLKKLIELNRKTTEELLNMCDVYYGADRLKEEEYLELVELIMANEQE